MTDLDKLIQYIAASDDIPIETAGTILGVVRRVRHQDVTLKNEYARTANLQRAQEYYQRRVEIAQQILCDDENGLTAEVLEEIADVIHGKIRELTADDIFAHGRPVPTDPTQVPTNPIREMLSIPQKSLITANDLFWAANRIINGFEFMQGIQLGSLKADIDQWRDRCNKFRNDNGLNSLPDGTLQD